MHSGRITSDPLLGPAVGRLLIGDAEFKRYAYLPPAGDLADYVFATPDRPMSAAEAFARLRWGGQFLYVSRSAADIQRLSDETRRIGFVPERPAGWFRRRLAGFIPGRRLHYLLTRKTLLIPPGEFTDRFTYQVELERFNGQWVVCKQVPSLEAVVARLRRRWPDMAGEILEKRARKFTEKIFPLFLTREAAILMILQEHLPATYARRVPRALDVQKDIRGYVRTLRMNWLRNAGPPLTQLQFALQSADLLRAVHDAADVIHLDLRLDNFVITEHGVGFVDFGSAVRGDEDVSQSPLLETLFDELMRTSQIQRMLDKMTRSGHVTAHHLRESRGKIDKSVDVFFLAVQFREPHGNPDLAGLIRYAPDSAEAAALSALTQQVLKPANPAEPRLRTAKDILRELELIERRLRKAGLLENPEKIASSA